MQEIFGQEVLDTLWLLPAHILMVFLSAYAIRLTLKAPECIPYSRTVKFHSHFWLGSVIVFYLALIFDNVIYDTKFMGHAFFTFWSTMLRIQALLAIISERQSKRDCNQMHTMMDLYKIYVEEQNGKFTDYS